MKVINNLFYLYVSSRLKTSPPVFRCVTRDTFEKEGELWCAEKTKVISDSSEMEVLENRPLLSTKGSEPVQVQPQKIHLRLRIGLSIIIIFSLRFLL